MRYEETTEDGSVSFSYEAFTLVDLPDGEEISEA